MLQADCHCYLCDVEEHCHSECPKRKPHGLCKYHSSRDNASFMNWRLFIRKLPIYAPHAQRGKYLLWSRDKNSCWALFKNTATLDKYITSRQRSVKYADFIELGQQPNGYRFEKCFQDKNGHAVCRENKKKRHQWTHWRMVTPIADPDHTSQILPMVCHICSMKPSPSTQLSLLLVRCRQEY